ncbi:glutamine amidotransferase [Noviherbaspirillum aridicola]|nr:glutamine amidotransferase [Noviherbaspirillum aridicola]
MKAIVVFKIGDTFDRLAARIGDFEDWIVAGLGPHPLPVRICDPRAGDGLPPPHEVAAAVVSGSHAMVTDRAAWSEALAEWLRAAVAARIPVLGICYGHQLLAHALGGEVGYHPGGIEIGTVSVTRTPQSDADALFARLPARFAAQAAHSQSVRRLPPGAVLLAGNDFEPHHAFRVGDCAWGVQFHPEFSPEATAAYIAHFGREGDASALPSDEAATVLASFAAVARDR